MGHVTFSIRNFYDSTSELVGIKSGILLNRFDISKILIEDYEDDFLKEDNLDSFIRLGSSDISDMVVKLRMRIGNLPKQSINNNNYEIINYYAFISKDIRVYGLTSIGLNYIRRYPTISKAELISKIMASEKIDITLATAVINVSIEQEDRSIILKGGTDWDGIIPLSKLFDSEIKPKNDLDFIPQKFIDYLAINGHEIEMIHWRNFERFCAEYFRRQGYEVLLGPGSHDGGIDIRVFKKEKNNSSPLILIQCKRHKESNKVTIETVKAFYADVLFEGAQEGLIATTGYIESGGKKVCNARKYNISFAEKENILSWAKNMWTHT